MCLFLSNRFFFQERLTACLYKHPIFIKHNVILYNYTSNIDKINHSSWYYSRLDDIPNVKSSRNHPNPHFVESLIPRYQS